MENIQRTVYASYIQSFMVMQMPMVYLPFTTLNEKFNVALNKTIDPTVYPSIKLCVIGNGGHKMQVDAKGFYTPAPVQHASTDAALFNAIPFVLRAANNDLTPAEAANYRLRTTVTYNNLPYIAYYGKLLDVTNTEPTLFSKTINNGVVTNTPFTPTVNNLTPTPVDLTVTAPNLVNNNYVNVTTLANLTLVASDVTEILNACTIIYGNPNYAIISEIGVCSGIDVQAQGSFGGVPSTYTESVGVQINTFENTFYPMAFINSGLTLTFNVGATEPLLDLIS